VIMLLKVEFDWLLSAMSQNCQMVAFLWLTKYLTSYHYDSQCILAHGTLKKATELSGEPLIVHNNSNIMLNTSIYSSFMYITCKKESKANLKLIDNVIVSSDASTLVYGELCWLTSLRNEEASGVKQRLIVCVLSVTEWLVSSVATRILIRT
jgi:hypothetical protein